MRVIPGAFLLLAIAACATTARPKTQTAAGPSNQEINDRFEQQIAERIADQKDEPAEQVFMNIQIDWLKKVPARRFLVIMNYGYARALGVRCTHCHVEQDFAADEKRPKRAAREMAVMHRKINELRNMTNLDAPPDDRTINCFTCHRGAVDPTKTDQ